MTSKNKAYSFLAGAFAGVAGFVIALSVFASGAGAAGAATPSRHMAPAEAIPQVAPAEDDQVQLPETGNEEQASSISSLSRDWTGHFDSLQPGGVYNKMEMKLKITELREDGSLQGTVSFYDLTEGGQLIGSYYVTGRIDMNDRSVNISFDRWENQGVMRNTRHYSGTLDESGTSVTGYCELVGGGMRVDWEMTAK